jgi:hypothetical protein
MFNGTSSSAMSPQVEDWANDVGVNVSAQFVSFVHSASLSVSALVFVG